MMKEDGDCPVQPYVLTLDFIERAMRSLYPDPKTAWTRSLICPPDLEPQVREAVERMGLREHFAIRTSSYLPGGQVLLLDDEAIEAPLTRGFSA